MPLPLVIWAVSAAVGAIVGARAVATAQRNTYRLAVLGMGMSGKTTLINSLRGEWVDGDPGRTNAPLVYEKVKLTANGRQLIFKRLVDVSGQQSAWPVWEDRVNESRHVLYLLKATHLLAPAEHRPAVAAQAWHRIEDDAGQIRLWLDEGRASLCVLVVTHRDLDPRFADLGEDAYEHLVCDQLDPIVMKLGGDRRVRIVTGSLVDPDAAAAVTDKIMQHIAAEER